MENAERKEYRKAVILISPFEAQGYASYFYAQTRQGIKRYVTGDTDENG